MSRTAAPPRARQRSRTPGGGDRSRRPAGASRSGARAPIDRRFVQRRREVAAASRTKRRRIVASLVAVAVLVGAGVATARSPLFGIEEIVVEHAEGTRSEQVQRAAAVPLGTNLLSVDLEAVAARVDDLAWVARTDVRRAPPAALVVAVEAREPAAVLQTEGANWVVDADGVVLAAAGPRDEEQLRVIEAPTALIPGLGDRSSDERVHNALDVLAGLPPDVRVEVIRMDADGHVSGLRAQVVTPSGEPVWVRFGRAEEVGAKAEVLGGLLEHLSDGQLAITDIEEIDVRVPTHPVVRPR